ncbi:S-layer homology domain-containing protein, partial [Phascolarctobacterium succinatutens]
MKKSLVLAMAMALGVTASAYAANPFSDVPAGHWAYDSINKLAAAGVIEGYGDSTFGGDKLMTRYEMAQIVAKAMAKGANVDKLAAEFADELDNLGVRVANLEKKADNVKITGQIRYEYADRDGAFGDNVAKNRLRTRLFVNGAVNDDWTYTARLQNDQNLANNKGDETTSLNQAYVTGRVGGLAVVAGKAPLTLVDGNLYDDTAEFVSVSYGKDVKLTAYAGQPTDYGFDNFYGASLSGKVGKLALSAGYDAFKDSLDAAKE